MQKQKSLYAGKRRRAFLGRSAYRMGRRPLGRLVKRPEVKEKIAGPATQAPFAGTNAFTLLNGLAPGAANAQRIGTKINMVRLHVRALITPSAGLQAALGAFAAVRCLIVYDKQPNAAVLTSTTLLDSDSVHAVRNPAGVRRYEILYDKTWGATDALFEYSGAADTYGGSHDVQIWLNLKNRVTEYNDGVAGTVADITTGSLYMLWYSSGVDNTHNFNVKTYTEFKYTDA